MGVNQWSKHDSVSEHLRHTHPARNYEGKGNLTAEPGRPRLSQTVNRHRLPLSTTHPEEDPSGVSLLTCTPDLNMRKHRGPEGRAISVPTVFRLLTQPPPEAHRHGSQGGTVTKDTLQILTHGCKLSFYLSKCLGMGMLGKNSLSEGRMCSRSSQGMTGKEEKVAQVSTHTFLQAPDNLLTQSCIADSSTR